MIAALLGTVGAVAIAVVCAVIGGWALGRLATGSLASLSLLSRLTDARGAVPLLVLAPLLATGLGLRPMLIVGLSVGLYQAIAVARLIQRRSGTLSLSLLGGIALGHSRVALAARRAAVSGAVWITVAQSALHVVTLQAVLALFALAPQGPSLGAAFAPGGPPALRMVAIVTTIFLLLVVDFGSARLLRHGR
jgi:hypothetical protein